MPSIGLNKTLKFGSNAKSTEKLTRQMGERGWDESLVKQTADSPVSTVIGFSFII